MQQSGRIKRLITGKGFGFITAADGVDYFVHAGDIVEGPHFDELTEGQGVTFEKDERSTRGPRARQVRVMSGVVTR